MYNIGILWGDNMQEIRLGDINFDSLKKLGGYGSNLTSLYTDGEVCYKIYKEDYKLEELYKKFRELDGLCVDGVILPKDLIMNAGKFIGYSMPYFKDSMTLSDRFSDRFVDKGLMLNAFYTASKIVRKLHEEGVVCQDISLENILIDIHGDIKICDSDSFAYKDHNSESFSKIFCLFLLKYRKQKLSLWEDIDRLSLILIFYYLLFEREIQHVSRHKYNIASREIKTVDNLGGIRDILLNKNKVLYDIPYMDEFISFSDSGTFDKNKCLTLRQKLYNGIDRLL